jgi:hypothetical protein
MGASFINGGGSFTPAYGCCCKACSGHPVPYLEVLSGIMCYGARTGGVLGDLMTVEGEQTEVLLLAMNLSSFCLNSLYGI